MAIDKHSRELFFDIGGRPYNNKDFEVLQQRILNVEQIYNSFTLGANINVTEYESYIVNGCDSKGAEGYVYIGGKARYVAADSNVAAANYPIYIKIDQEFDGASNPIDTVENRLYADEAEKIAFTVYTAKWSTNNFVNDTSGSTYPYSNIITIDDVNDLDLNKRLKGGAYLRSLNNKRGDVTIEPGASSSLTVDISESGKIKLNVPIITGGTVTGGTANRISMYDSATSLTSADIRNAGGKIGISVDPSEKFQVTGGNIALIDSSVDRKIFVGESATYNIGIDYDVSANTGYIRSMANNGPAPLNIMVGSNTGTTPSQTLGLEITSAGIVRSGASLYSRGDTIGFNAASASSTARYDKTLIKKLKYAGSDDLDVAIESGRVLMVGSGRSSTIYYDISGQSLATKTLYLTSETSIQFVTNVDSASTSVAFAQLTAAGRMITPAGFQTTSTISAGAISSTSVASSGAISGTTITASSSMTAPTFNGNLRCTNSQAAKFGTSTSEQVEMNYNGSNFYVEANNTMRYFFKGVVSIIEVPPVKGAPIEPPTIITANAFTFDLRTGTSTFGVGTATDWVATSDRKLKDNIKYLPSQLNAVSKIGKLFVEYNLKLDSTNNRKLGFIAQDIEEIYPEFVSEAIDDDNEGETTKAINYAKMVGPLYSAITELKDIIEKQQKEIDTLKSLIN